MENRRTFLLWYDNSIFGTYRRVTAMSNGWRGMGGTSYGYYEDMEVAYNNWRGLWTKVYSFDAAGAKSGGIAAKYVRMKAYSNYTHGLWFDIGISNVYIQDCLFKDNMFYGVYCEISPGPFLIQDSVIVGNKVGINHAESRSVIVLDSIIASNKDAQIQTRNSTRDAHDKYSMRILGEDVILPYDGSLGLRIYRSTIVVPKGSRFINAIVGSWGGSLTVGEYHDDYLKTYRGDENTFIVYDENIFPIFDKDQFFIRNVDHATWRKHILGGEENSKVKLLR